MVSRAILRNDCHIDTLSSRRNTHLLLFMHKQSKKTEFLKENKC